MAKGTRLIRDEVDLSGRVSGAVLAAVRRQVGLTQERLAERLGVGLTTLQAWESGRNPLPRLPYGRLRQVRRSLAAAGAEHRLLRQWDAALDADSVLADLDGVDPLEHPLAHTVPDRATTDLLAWPLTGQPPRALVGDNITLNVGRGERAAAAAALRRVVDVDGAPEPESAMLRRQVVYLVADDPASQGWLAEQRRRDAARARDLRTWSPEWPVARSAAVTAASSGDLEPLHRFLAEGLADEATITANLNYWAYWAGETGETWSADGLMLEPATWSGERLLETLLFGIDGAPYADLSAHTLWALLRARRQLAMDPAWRPRIAATVRRALDSGQLGESARIKLEQVNYMMGSV